MRVANRSTESAKNGLTLFFLFYLLSFISHSGCGKKEEARPPASPPPAVEANLPKIVGFGNSLTAGLGLTAGEAYPAQLQKLLDADGYRYEVINAGVSGDTSSGGLRRIDWSLQDNVRFLILELGANDILRGQPLELVRVNLSEIIKKAQSRGVTVLLAGMEAPTNSGDEYRKQVHDLYPSLAKEHAAILIPFFLKSVFTTQDAIQPDGTHPNAKGAHLIAQAIYARLRPLLRR